MQPEINAAVGTKSSVSLEKSIDGRSLGVFALTVTAVLAAFYWPFLANRAAFYILDFPSIWYPMLSYMGERLHQGQLPLWNPYVCNGIPQTFSPSFHYPVNWLYAFLPFNVATAVAAVVHQLIGGIGVFLLSAELGLGMFGAFMAGFVFALSGWMFSMQTICIIQAPSAWSPLALWCAMRAGAPARSQQLFFTGMLALCCGLMIVSGLVEISGPALLIVFGYCLVKFCSDKSGIDGRRALLALRVVAIVLGVLLAAPVLLPELEWAKHSMRAYGFQLKEIVAHSASWYDLACLVLAQPFGDLYENSPFVQIVSSFSERDPSIFIPYIASIYIGPLPVTLAIYAAFGSAWQARRPLLLVLLLAVVAALGWHTPIAPFVIDVLHLTSLRFPIKLLLWVVLPVTLLAAAGMHMFMAGTRSTGSKVALVAWIIALVAGGTFCLADQSLLSGIASIFSIKTNQPHWLAALRALGRSTIIASLVGIAACIVLILRSHFNQRQAKIACVGMLSISLFSMLSTAWQFMFHPGPADFYRTPIILAEQIKRHLEHGSLHLPRVCLLEQPPPLPSWFKMYRDYGANYKAYFRQMLVRMTGIEVKVDDVISPIHGETAEHSLLWGQALQAHAANDDRPLAEACRICGADFVCTPRLIEGSSGGAYRLDSRFFTPVAEDRYLNFVLYKPLQPCARAYVAQAIKWGSPHAEVLKMLTHPDSAPVDLNKTTILEREDANHSEAIRQENQATHDSAVELVEDQPEHVALSVNTKAKTFLVLCDEFYPGWYASVDGKNQSIVRANGLCRAVGIPAGLHRVDFYYRPLSVIAGNIMALLALIVTLWFVAIGLIHYRRLAQRA